MGSHMILVAIWAAYGFLSVVAVKDFWHTVSFDTGDPLRDQFYRIGMTAVLALALILIGQGIVSPILSKMVQLG